MKKIYLIYSPNDISQYTLMGINSEFNEYGYNIINASDYENDEQNHYSEYEKIIEKNKYLIKKANIVISLISGNSMDTHNQFFELGYALGANKDVIIVAPPNLKLPYYLKNITYILHEPPFDNITYRVIPFLESYSQNYKQTDELDIDTKTREVTIQEQYNKNPHLFNDMAPQSFENTVRELLQEKGFEVEKPRGKTDYGYDLIINNFKGHKKVLVEIKKYQSTSKVSISPIQQLFGAMSAYNGDAGLIITTGRFTASAKNFAGKLHPSIYLMTIDELIKDSI